MDIHGNQCLTPEILNQYIIEHPRAKRFWVAFSGGVDSQVLLDLVHKLYKKHHLQNFGHHQNFSFQIGAVHVHHGLSPNAEKWAEHCQEVCDKLEIPLQILYIQANDCGGESPEEVARTRRLQAFQQFLQSGDCLLMAHHAEDQAETILMRLCRGTGPQGLGGIPQTSYLKSLHGEIEIGRPLLNFSKDLIEKYAREHQLQWIEDESNQNLRFDRNFLRHEIIPRLKTRWPTFVQSVLRAGNLCLETAEMMQEVAKEDFLKVENSAASLSVSELLKLDTGRRQAVIRYWLQSFGVALPSKAHMDRIDCEILQAKNGSKPRLKISHYEIRRWKDELRVVVLKEAKVK